LVILENTTFQFGNVGDSFRPVGKVEWYDTPNAIEGSIIPTGLIYSIGGTPTAIPVSTFRGIDFSADNKTIIPAPGVGAGRDFRLLNCKLNPSAIISGNISGVESGRVLAINCDSGATNYRNEHYRHAGVQFTETTVFRSGGASDGSRPISWRCATTADANWINPFETLPFSVWNDLTGARTVDVFGYWDGGVPSNGDIWLDLEYLGSVSFPISSTATSGKANFLDPAVPLTVDNVSVWGGGDTTTRFRLRVTFTAAMKGLLTATVRIGRASAVFYIDPKMVVT
jgi:hypothetical protein